MLIKGARIYPDHRLLDIRLTAEHITEIATFIEPIAGERIVQAHGAALIPSLSDHHIHLMAFAAAMQSIDCQGINQAEFNALLSASQQMKSADWLRVINYHDDIAGSLNRAVLDRLIPDRPVRVQHCSGRLWIFNSAGLQQLGLDNCASSNALDSASGHLVNADGWLREQLASQRPSLTVVSQELASHGISHLTDTTPANALDELEYFHAAFKAGELGQQFRLMGNHTIPASEYTGEVKLHLLEADLPTPDQLSAHINAAHTSGRNVAIHCVTLIELLLALNAWKSAGVKTGDRIEHAAITPSAQLEDIANLGLRVVTQPHFIWQRGDRYRRHVDHRDQEDLYRLRSFLDAGVGLAAGSDAAHGTVNPWRAMQCAVDRSTMAGEIMGAEESLSPEQALALYTSELDAPGVSHRKIAIGEKANICLLDRAWYSARQNLAEVNVKLTLRHGKVIHSA